MSIRGYILVLSGSTLIAWAGWVLVLFYLPPDSVINIVLFLISAMAALTGTLTIPGFFLRYKFVKIGQPIAFLRTAFRQSLLFAVLIVFTLMLQGERYLSLLNAILLIVALVFLEFFFISKNPKHTK